MKQAAKPSVFMPWFAGLVATSLGIDSLLVKTTTEQTAKELKEAIAAPIQAAVWLRRPTNPNVNAGGGRRGTVLERILGVTLYTRAGRDRLGDDSQALGRHWDLEDGLINSLLLKVPSRVAPSDPKFFIAEMRLLDEPGVDRHYRVDASKYSSDLTFLVSYLAPTTEALT